jgi:hypothetical protein
MLRRSDSAERTPMLHALLGSGPADLTPFSL